MRNDSPGALCQRIENAIGIIGLRVRPGGMDLMPSVSSVDLVKMILLDGASLLAHFDAVENPDVE